MWFAFLDQGLPKALIRDWRTYIREEGQSTERDTGFEKP